MVSPTLTESVYISDWLLYEEDDIGRYSRDNITVAAGQTLQSGAVVAKDASGNIVEFSGATGAENEAIGILVGSIRTTSATAANAIIARTARIDPSALVWKSTLTNTQKSDALASLESRGIVSVGKA